MYLLLNFPVVHTAYGGFGRSTGDRSQMSVCTYMKKQQS